MIIELGIISALCYGAWKARKVVIVRATYRTILNKFSHTKIGEMLLLEGATDKIEAEFESETEKLEDDHGKLTVEETQLEQWKEDALFLQEVLDDQTIPAEEKQEAKNEFDAKMSMINIMDAIVPTKRNLIEKREKLLVAYKENAMANRLRDAQVAKLLFQQKHDLDRLYKNLESVRTLGKHSLTDSVIQRYSVKSFSSSSPKMMALRTTWQLRRIGIKEQKSLPSPK